MSHFFLRIPLPLTSMTPTGKRFPTIAATGNSLHETGNILSFLVTAVAELGGERGAGRATLLTVAGVSHWVVAPVPPPARLPALRGLGATLDGGIENTGPAFTTQLIKTYVGTLLTVTRVT